MSQRSTPSKLPRATDVLKEVESGRAASSAGAAHGGGVKETVESILIAFIFAFMFRAFVVEAFVIPTGSMAPTLLGAHMRVACDDCGHEFKVNYSAQGEGDDMYFPSRLMDARGQLLTQNFICENCGYTFTSKPGPDIHFGDRILVLKYLYLFQDPERWDVIVFKSPASPEKYQYEQNYIKRLVGLPHESVMILDGDIYVGSGGSTEAATFQIQTKPRIVQDALWRIVYDNDHHPRGLPRRGQEWRQPWTPQAPDNGWKLGDGPVDGRVLEFDNPSGAGVLQFDRTANSTARRGVLTDWLGYDQLSPGQEGREVADLKLDLYYERRAGEGPLRLKLSKFDDTFVAEIDRASARLIRRGPAGETIVAQNVPLPPVSGPVHVEFMNVDYQVTLRIDGKDIIQTTRQDYAPDVAELLSLFGTSYPAKPAIEIEAERQICSISHLRLWRDIYYYNSGNQDSTGGIVGIPQAKWGSPRNIITLGDDEYFVLGDNSQISGDSRYWSAPIRLEDEDLDVGAGRVPGRFLLGKAFFVYWPAGYGTGLPGRLKAVPNFGEMRFIH